MMGTWLPEHVENRNKHTRKFVRQFVYLQRVYSFLCSLYNYHFPTIWNNNQDTKI